MKKISNNDFKIYAKIKKRRHWAAKGRPNVDFDDLLGRFESNTKSCEFLDRPKIVELVPKGGLWTDATHWHQSGWITGGGLANITFFDQFDQSIRMISR